MRSLTLTEKEISNLATEVSERDLKTTPPGEYELLRVKDKDVFFVLYTTGKLVFRESEGIDNLLDNVLVEQEYTVIGTDEAGKGEWYGPLVVAGVALTPDNTSILRKLGVGDSKELSSSRIYEIGAVLMESEIEKDVKVLQPEYYNTVYEAFRMEKKTLNDILLWAHTEIIHNVLDNLSLKKVKVVIDKFDTSLTPSQFKSLEKFDVDITQKTGGESEPAVAAASVLAKFVFEEEVLSLNEKFGIDLRNTTPEGIPPDILPLVAKLHFRNVKKALQ